MEFLFVLDQRRTVAGCEVASNNIARKRPLALVHDTNVVLGIALGTGSKVAVLTAKWLLGQMHRSLG
jgi:hypothetical protein